MPNLQSYGTITCSLVLQYYGLPTSRFRGFLALSRQRSLLRDHRLVFGIPVLEAWAK